MKSKNSCKCATPKTKAIQRNDLNSPEAFYFWLGEDGERQGKDAG